MIVDPPLARFASNDVYLDDEITIVPDLSEEHKLRARCGVLLAMHVVARPIPSSTEQIPRLPLPSIQKLKAEGRLEETKTVLGWTINTREFTISIPTHKFTAWSASITKILLPKPPPPPRAAKQEPQDHLNQRRPQGGPKARPKVSSQSPQGHQHQCSHLPFTNPCLSS